jgi:hypothetical protein
MILDISIIGSGNSINTYIDNVRIISTSIPLLISDGTTILN